MQTPLNLTELAVQKFYARDREGQVKPDPVLSKLEGAMLEARKGAEQLAGLAEALANDVGLNNAARAVKLRALALKVGEKVAGKLDGALGAAADETDALEAGMLPGAPRDANELAMRGEIRSRLAGMPAEERRAAMASAINDDPSGIIAAAIFSGPPLLAGMTNSEFEMRLDGWRRVRFPEQYDRAGRLKKATEALERGAASFMEMIETASTPEAIAAQAASEKTAAAAAALSE